MAEQVLDPDRLILEITRVMGHRLVEIQFPLLHELHDERRRERLGKGSDVINRLRRGADVAFDVGETESLRP